MATKNATIKVTVLGDADSLSRMFGKAGDDADKAEGRMSGSFRTIGAAATGFLAGGALSVVVGFGSELLTLGGQLDTMSKKADAVFGASASSVRAWADENNEAFGVSEQALTGMATNMADLLKPMGFTGEAAAGMSKELVGMSGALSVWSGGTKSAAEVSELLTDAMLGETDGLKALGISLSAAEVDARLAANGQAELTGSALEMARAQAVQQLVMEKSADAQKAWNDGTMDSVKAQNEAKAQVEQLKASLAEGLVPVFQAVVGFVTGTAIPAFQQLSAFVSENSAYFVAAAVGIATLLVPAFIAWAVSAGAAAVATIVAAAPVIALGIGIAALTAGVIYAYQHFDWFRTAVDAVGSAVGWLYNWIVGNWPTLLAVLTGPFGVAALLISRNWDSIKAGAFAVRDGIVDAFNQVVGFIAGVGGRISGAAAGLWSGITSSFRSALNAIIRGWNSLDFTIPGFKIGPIGYSGFTLGLPHVNYLAAGGIVKASPGGTLAVIGEGGQDEAVVPLPKGGRGVLGGNTYNITVKVPPTANLRDAGREITRAIREYEQASTGR